jgi:hypothetical protein
MRLLVFTIAMVLSPVLALAQSGATEKSPNLELRLQPGKLVNGIPDSFTFAFVNISAHEVRMPQPSKCMGADYGTILLALNFTSPEPVGIPGGGCGGGVGGNGHRPSILDLAKNWKVIKPHDSLSLTYTREELFSTLQASGTYDFWAEYTPSKISAEDQRALTEAGIDFPRNRLVSSHLIFIRKP